MKIESLTRIIGAVPLNTPPIKQIENIKIYASKILAKDLFIDINNSQEDITEAITNGAYCILSETIQNITDKEIAWLHVNNMELALIKLARFYALEKAFVFLSLNSIQYKLSQCLHFDKKIQTLSVKLEKALMQIINAKKYSIFFTVNNQYIDKIDPTIKIPSSEIKPNKIYKKGFFSSSFIYNNKYINSIRLSALFVPSLCSILKYFDDLNISFDVENFNNFEHFYPQFVNNKIHKKDFGTTEQVLIFEKDFELFLKEIIFLEKTTDIKSLVIILKNNKIINFTCKAEKIVYNAPLDIKNLQNKKFKYALINGDIEDFEELLQTQNNTQMTFF
jgi:ferrochelatase